MSANIPMLMADGLRRNAWKCPVKIAAKDKFRETTYGDLDRRINQLANGLLSLGVRKGDGVALSVGGIVQGINLNNPQVAFIDVVKGTLPFLYISTIGSLLIVIAGLILVLNLLSAARIACSLCCKNSEKSGVRS